MSLSVQQVSKRYGPVIALRSAGLVVAPGEVRALFGGNGSGKSTLAKIVSGCVQADTGSIEVDGRPVPPDSPKAAHAAGIAITFQDLSLLPDLTVAENLSLERMPRVARLFRDERAIKVHVRAVLERLGLAHLADLPVHALQIDEKYLVELAKALRLQPKYIVLDELTSALREHEVVIVKRILREHRAEGGGAIVVSHRIAEIHELCDTITVLRNGEVVADGSLSEVSTENLVNWVGGTLRRHSSSELRREDGRAQSSRSVRVALHDIRLEADAPPLSL
jgi:ABC-type sugar transport system ATPase subunit